MKDAYIVSSVRTAVGKAPRGSLHTLRPDDMGAIAVKSAIDRVNGLEAEHIDDLLMGCAFPELVCSPVFALWRCRPHVWNDDLHLRPESSDFRSLNTQIRLQGSLGMLLLSSCHHLALLDVAIWDVGDHPALRRLRM